jgi:hypothetical protein
VLRGECCGGDLVLVLLLLNDDFGFLNIKRYFVEENNLLYSHLPGRLDLPSCSELDLFYLVFTFLDGNA